MRGGPRGSALGLTMGDGKPCSGVRGGQKASTALLPGRNNTQWPAFVSGGSAEQGGTMMNASVAIQVLPKVATNRETVRAVDEVIAYIKSFGLHTEVGPFETTVEGDYDTLMEIVKGCSRVCVEAGVPGVMTYVKINYAPAGVLTMEEKTAKHREEGHE